MKIEEIHKKRSGIPHMSHSQAEELTSFILEHRPKNILELGFCHGVSTCYMAGALDELKQGNITTIDLTSARNLEPNIDTLLSSLGLTKYVTVFYEPTSYIWRLMKMLEQDPSPRFDLCYIDGAHDWFTDGFAFFLVNRLLKTDGWIIFDDLDWTYEKSPSLKDTDMVKNMPADEKSTPQVRKVYELLVKPHPSYDQFRVNKEWAYAHKKSTQYDPEANNVKKEIVHQYQDKYVGMAGVMQKALKKVARTLKM